MIRVDLETFLKAIYCIFFTIKLIQSITTIIVNISKIWLNFDYQLIGPNGLLRLFLRKMTRKY